MYNHQSSHAPKSRQKLDCFEQEQLEDLASLKQQNSKLKKMLKQAQSKRTQITKQCSNLSKIVQKIQSENNQLKERLHQGLHKQDGQKYRWDQLRFLNKQLNSQIEELRQENQSISEKLRYNSDILQRKYAELQQKTYKRMEQAAKRIKKTMHYLTNLSAKQIDKTRQHLIQSLRKSIDLLKGKYSQEMGSEGEIEQLMSPLKSMQQEIMSKAKQNNMIKLQNQRLQQQVIKLRKMEKQQLPMFKEGIQKLKKNLAQVRGQLSQNQYQKLQIKKKYEQKIKQMEYKHNELFKECRKIKLQKKIYQNKLQQLEADVQQEKERLLQQNQLLKKLYNNNNQNIYQIDNSSSRMSHQSHLKGSTLLNKRTQQKRGLKKNLSNNYLKGSTIHAKASSQQELGTMAREVEISEYNEQASMLSQQNLKQQICRIDEEIMEIQRNLTKELEDYR